MKEDKMRLDHTQSTDVIDQKNKISLQQFKRIVWGASQTNLHFKDFQRLFAKPLKRMYGVVNFDTIQIPGAFDFKEEEFRLP